jgi:hypothetical protein
MKLELELTPKELAMLKTCTLVADPALHQIIVEQEKAYLRALQLNGLIKDAQECRKKAQDMVQQLKEEAKANSYMLKDDFGEINLLKAFDINEVNSRMAPQPLIAGDVPTMQSYFEPTKR